MCIVGYRLDITNGSVPSWMPPNRPCFPPESPNIEALSLFHEKRKLSGFRKKIIGESNVRRLPLPAFCYKISESRYSYWWDFSMLVCTDKSSAFVPDKKAPANGNDGNGNIWCIDSVCWCDSAEISSLRWKNGNETKKFVNSQRSNEIKLELLVLFRIFPMQFERIEKFNLFERFVRRLFWATRNTQRKTFPSNKNFYFIQKNLSLQ